MADRAEKPKQKPKPEAEMTESDLDKVSGGAVPKTPPSGPIPIPYPNQST